MKHLASILLLSLAAASLAGCASLSKNKNSQTAAKTENTASSASSASGVKPALTDAAISGEWTIVKVKGQDVPMEDHMPYVNFVPEEGRFYASNGCNTINGEFAVSGGKTLKLSNVATTMMLCHDVPFEHEITAILSGEVQPEISISNVGHESYLTITDKLSGLSIEGRRHNMEFLNGQWRVAQIKGKTINDEEANIFIDLGEMKVHGNTGCNFFNGEIYIDPSKTNSVEFGKMGLTRMACPKYDQEQAMMLALEETTSAIKGDNGRVMLLNASGDPVIILERQAVE